GSGPAVAPPPLRYPWPVGFSCGGFRRSRSAAARIVSGSLIRPGRSLGPSASAPISGPTKCQPRAVSVLMFAVVAGFAYIASFMAGAARGRGAGRGGARAVGEAVPRPTAGRGRLVPVSGGDLAGATPFG